MPNTSPSARNVAFGAGALLLLGALCVLARVGDAPRPASPPRSDVPDVVLPDTPTSNPLAPLASPPPTAPPPSLPNVTAPNSATPSLVAPNAVPPKPALPNIAAPKTAPNVVAPRVATPDAKPPRAKPAAQAFARALQLQKSGKTEAAVAAYRQVLKLEPNASSAWLNLSVLYLGTQRPALAIEPLRRVAALEPKNANVRRQLAEVLVAVRRPREAVAPLREVVRLEPRDKQTRAGFAQLLSALNQPRDAYEQWTTLANLDPKNPAPALFAGTLALEALQRPAEAEKWLRRAYELQNKAKTRDPRPPLLLAQTLLARGKPKEAARVCQSAIAQFPDVVELRTTLADARLSLNDLPGATAAAREAVKIVPPDADKEARARLHVGLARLLLASAKGKEANGQLQLAARLSPQDARTKSLLADALRQSKNGASNGTRFATAPPADLARLKAAQKFANAQKWREAAREYAAYTQAQPRDAGALAEFATVQAQRGLWRDAEQLWAQVSRLAPRETLPFLRRFDALVQLNRNPEALQLIRAALSLAPRDFDVLLRAADAEANAGNYSGAREHLQRVLSLKPGFAPGYEAVAKSATRSREVGAALTFLEAHVAKHPRQREAFAAILKLYAENGQSKKGRDVVKAFIARDRKNLAPRLALDSFDLDNAKRQLAELQARDKRRATTPASEPKTPATASKPD